MKADTSFTLDLTKEEAYLLRIYAEPSLMGGQSQAKSVLKNATRLSAQERLLCEAHGTLANKLKKLPE